MSQITRCPSCATTFKVVADQLRISEGWVRCGQCKEVFDAIAHLQVAEPEPLLPELSFDGGRAARASPVKAPEPMKVWGSARAVASAAMVAVVDAPAVSASAQAMNAVLDSSEAVPTSPDAAAPVMQVPVPVIPAFLTASQPLAAPAAVPDWRLEPASPFGWRSREPAVASSFPLLQGVNGLEERSSVASFGIDLDLLPFAEIAPVMPPAFAAGGTSDETLPKGDSGGYELPFAQLRGSEWPADMEAESSAPLLIMPSSETEDPAVSGRAEVVPSPRLAGAGWSSLSSVIERGQEAEEPQQAAVSDRVPESEPGFVRAARRKAFWSTSWVRIALGFCGAAFGLALSLQWVVRERDGLVAQFPGMHSVLAGLCRPVGCTLRAPQRIADVVIDSSSFRKARSDAYELALTVKNRAGTVVAMPALELTLTDVQEQPVVRRVMRVDELAAPAALVARGEWNGFLSLQVTSGAERVAGYRVLVFYP